MITETKILNFLLLAERKNFSATAVATHISQQALSAQIASLEEDLGFALFIRNTKRVELTEAGERDPGPLGRSGHADQGTTACVQCPGAGCPEDRIF